MSESEDDRSGSSRRDAWKVWGGAIAIAALGFALTFQFVEPGPDPHVRLASGAADGAYHAFGERYREVLSESEIDLQVQESAGSVENVARLRAGDADIAFVQGGVLAGDAAGLVALGSLYYEPLWVFHRAGVEVSSLVDLRGLRVEIGPEGSGTRAVAIELLLANGVDVTNASLGGRSSGEAIDGLLAGEVDVVFLVSSSRAERIRDLMRREGREVRLLDFARHEAYERNFRYLRTVVVPRGMFDLGADLPDRDIHLVAPLATLLARADLHPALPPLILSAARRVHGPGDVFEDPDEFPSPSRVEAPLSVAADHWYRNGVSFLYRVLPFPLAALLDRLKIMLLPLLTLLLPLIRFAPPLYRWRIRSKIFRWYRVLRRIELAAKRGGTPEVLAKQARKLAEIEDEILRVKVPPSYMEELYNLRMHLRLVRRSVTRESA